MTFWRASRFLCVKRKRNKRVRLVYLYNCTNVLIVWRYLFNSYSILLSRCIATFPTHGGQVDSDTIERQSLYCETVDNKQRLFMLIDVINYTASAQNNENVAVFFASIFRKRMKLEHL